MKTNYHQFNKFYKIRTLDAKREFLDFLRSYQTLYGVTVASILVCKVEERFGIRYTNRWLTVILKSAGIPRATRAHRRRKGAKETAKAVVSNLPALMDAGLAFFDELFMQGAGRVIADVLNRRDAPKFVRGLALVLMSGKVKRLSEYESGAIAGVSYQGKSLSDAVIAVSNQPALATSLNERLLEYHVSVGVTVENLYADGHTKPFYTKCRALAGKMSASERVIAGSRMVLTHQQDGLLLWLDYRRIDEHLGKPFIDDSMQVLSRLPDVTSPVTLVMDREGSGRTFATYASELGVPTLTLLQRVCYSSVADFTVDAEYPHYYRFADAGKRPRDARYFLPYTTYDGHQLVYAQNAPVIETAQQAQQLYKARWNANENPLKFLNQKLAFNVNTGQNVQMIDHPKQVKAKREATEKLVKVRAQQQQLQRTNPRKSERQVQKAAQLVKLENRIDILEKTQSTPVIKVAIKDTRADSFISIVKAQIYNTMLFLLMTIGWGNINAQELLFVDRALIRRRGTVCESELVVIFNFQPLHSRRDRLKQAQLFAAINRKKLRTKNGKLIILHLLDEKQVRRKNSCPG